MNVLLIVTGGIAAYKSCDIIGLLKRRGDNVKVVMTENATEFITPLTLQTLSASKVHIRPFQTDEFDVEHIELAKWADAVIVAPASYNFIGKIANGIADDLASTIVAAIPPTVKVHIAPAMNTRMWENPILKRNIAFLESLGRYHFIPPREAMLACGDVGAGALARPADIVAAVK